MADVWANSMACHPRATCHTAGCCQCHLANSMSWCQSYVSHCRVLPPGEFNGMSSQSHVSHCRVLPLSEFTVTIPEPHATLQDVRIPSAILKIVFPHILLFCFYCSLGFDERRLSNRLRYTCLFSFRRMLLRYVRLMAWAVRLSSVVCRLSVCLSL